MKRGPKKSKIITGLELKLEKDASESTDKKYRCSICHNKRYKYLRNKLRHEKYECVTKKLFGCDKCGKRYSQKKTLIMHVAQKHVKGESPTNQ